MPEATATTTTGDGSGTPAPTTSTDVLGPDGKPLDPARALSAIERLKGEATKVPDLEQQLNEAMTKLKEFEDAKLSDTDKLTKRNTELETRTATLEREIQELRVGIAVAKVAQDAGALYPDAVVNLIDLSTLEFEADGKPKNADKIVEALKVKYPAMFGQAGPGSADAGARGSAAGGGSSMNDLIRRAAGH